MNMQQNKPLKLLSSLKSWTVHRIQPWMKDIDKFLFFRITLGMFLAFKALSLSPNWLDFYSDKGFFTRDVIEVNNSHTFFSYFECCDFLSSALNIEMVSAFLLIKYLFIFFSFTLIVGLFTRTSAFFLLLINVMLTNSFFEYSYGVDYFLTSLLFYSLFFPLGFKHTIDKIIIPILPRPLAFLRKGIKARWVTLILGIHLSIIYFISGITKAFGSTWWNGEAVWKAMNRPGNDLVLYLIDYVDLKFFYIALGVSTIFVELLYPLFIWIKRTQPVWLFITLMMHLFIGVIMELYLFASVMIFYNLIAFSNFSESDPLSVSKT